MAFTNTKYTDTINSLIDGFKDKLKNPYYLYSDLKATPTIYYNQNVANSSLDEGSKLQYSPLGNDSPSTFNKIENMLLYGIDKITTNLENGEWGLESSSIEGEAIILPNTITPIPGDYFTIKYLNHDLLFKVTGSTTDTIENGSNFYKIEYKLDQLDTEKIEKQVYEKYTMIVNNTGTQFKSIIRKNDFEYIEQLGDLSNKLKQYYKEIFYSQRVQSFIYMNNAKNFYDPFLLEFLIRNRVLNNKYDYIYINHQIPIPATFSLDYDKTFFRMVEQIDLENINRYKTQAQARFIDNPLSIMNDMLEDYFEIIYINNKDYAILNEPLITILDSELINRIKNKQEYDRTESSLQYRNIIIKYMNNKKITGDDIKTINDIDFCNNKTLYYEIPIVIYIIEKDLLSLMS